MDGYKQLGDHRDGCLALGRGDGVPFVMNDGHEWALDRLGRKGGSQMWHRFKCNDTRCPAVMLVRWDIIAACASAPVVAASETH